MPAIYTKLLDVDKVELVIGPYATAQIAPAMPIVMQKKMFIGLLGLAVNIEFNYPNYFAMIPSGPDAKPAFTKGFFDIAMAQGQKPATVAIVAADQEFSRNAADGARENAKMAGLKMVYDRPIRRRRRICTDRARHPGQQTGPRRRMLLPAGLLGIVRSVNESSSGPKRSGAHGRPANDRDQDPTRSVARRLDQLRVLAAGARKWSSPALPISSGATRPKRRLKGSIRSATTWRHGVTLSCLVAN